jgi:hypothetical protein
MTRLLLTAALVAALTAPAVAAARVKVFVFAEPDPALGGLVSTALLDSVEDLQRLIGKRMLGYGGMSNTKKRADATMLVQVVGRTIDASDTYSVRVRATFNGQTHEFTGTDVRQWKRCMLPIAAALSQLAKPAR